jgi:CRISPR-associated protein Cmr1
MGKKEVVICFETITPLWFGDAWQKNEKVRPSALIGNLRFWFSVYWKFIKRGQIENLDDNGIPIDSLLSKDNKTFPDILLKHIRDGNIGDDFNFDKEVDNVLNELELPVPSRIFGCTGWDSRVNIEILEYCTNKLNLKEIEFNFPNDVESKFWIEKILFQSMNNINGHDRLKIKLKTMSYWWDTYLKDFISFFGNKIILIGGKLSFGFGFAKIKIEELQDVKEQDESIGRNSSINNFLLVDKIEGINYHTGKKVLGYNFKYHLRKNEEKKFREKNFGSKGNASKVYVSHLQKEDNNSVYLIVLNNLYDSSSIPDWIVDKYKKQLNEYKKEV